MAVMPRSGVRGQRGALPLPLAVSAAPFSLVKNVSLRFNKSDLNPPDFSGVVWP